LKQESAVLYAAKVMHRRLRPAPYRFVYRVFSILLDVDRLPKADTLSPIFSVNRFNLLSFYERDHVPGARIGLREWANQVLARHGIDSAGLNIRLLCFPRILGLVFNPLSIWYCEDGAGRPRAAICEVRNTFGERHSYLLAPGTENPAWPLRQSHSKDFHVSPFIGMRATYQFRLSRPDETLKVLIREFESDRLLLVASQTGEAQRFDTRNLLRQLLRVPLQTLKIVFAIHWQALKIWRRGTPFHAKPAPPTEEVT
jgi:DUF1365 family protein